ncbi:hypothetical protein [Mesonia mobilis]|uniref:Uncharacterized protein n=1 Tax=Mesonia mobilis TaxID=369791 RepID=A0ABQ3BW58_9FLAO|nr:hypothetical protein [Mesonia mobilis]GGZ59366.1 hypothetical protein GCM10008088_21280 [Mesonia mobilis]
METQPVQPAPSHITPGKWALYIFVAGLPLIGLIMLLVWAFSSDTNTTRQNWAKGMLLLYVIVIALAILMSIFFGGLAAMFGSMAGSGY